MDTSPNLAVFPQGGTVSGEKEKFIITNKGTARICKQN